MVILLLPLPLVFAAGATVGAQPCQGCLTFWVSTASAAWLALRNVRGGPTLLILVGVATIVLTRLCSGGERAPLAAGLVENGLRTVGFFGQPAPAFDSGTLLPIPLVARYAVFVTRCTECTARATGARLRLSRAAPDSVVLVAPNADPGWVAPAGYERASWIRDAKTWEQARLDPQGAPALYRVESGRVVEALR